MTAMNAPATGIQERLFRQRKPTRMSATLSRSRGEISGPGAGMEQCGCGSGGKSALIASCSNPQFDDLKGDTVDLRTRAHRLLRSTAKPSESHTAARPTIDQAGLSRPVSGPPGAGSGAVDGARSSCSASSR
jgi:hypothetical protein